MFASLIAGSLRAAVESHAEAAFDAFLLEPGGSNFSALTWAALAHQQAWQASDAEMLRTVDCSSLEAVAKTLAPGLTLTDIFDTSEEDNATSHQAARI